MKKEATDVSRRLRQLFLILVLLAPAMSLLVAYMLYRTGLQQEKERLIEMVESQVMLIDSVALFDVVNSQKAHPEGAEGATISQISDAFAGRGFGETGEFLFAKSVGGEIRFHFMPRFYKGDSPLVLNMSQESPIREALMGRKGVEITVDYRGTKVLAAYAPVYVLKSGIVAKIDLAEIRRPYLTTFLISTAIFSIVFLLGITVFLKNIRRVKEGFEAQRAAEEELTHLRIFLSNIIDSMPSVLVGIDNDLKVTHWNKEAEIITDVRSDDAVGKPLAEVFSSLEIRPEDIQESIRTSTVKRMTNIMKKTEKGSRCEDITVYPLIANGVTGVVLRIDDVTERRLLEEKFNQSSKLDAIGLLAGGVAHDFNNMLTGILGAAELLKLSAKDPKAVEYIDLILRAGRQSADLTAKLLAFGRKGEIFRSPTDLHRVIDDTAVILARTVDKAITITVNKRARYSIVEGDGSALQNVLINLGINASNAIQGQGEIEIDTADIRLDKEYCDASSFEIAPGDYIQLDIKDNGCGIPPENLGRIFEPFFTTSPMGTGLGLSAVYGTVKNHHGAINIYSEEGKGTVFHLYLPVMRGLGEVSEDVAFRFEPGSGTILLVDDESIVRRVGKGMLEKMGYAVLTAKNGSEAVEVFEKQHDQIDLVILDMIMPEMNGRETFFKMKEIDNDCRILISSGFWKEKDIQELKEKGLDGFIRKPFLGVELSRAIKNIIVS